MISTVLASTLVSAGAAIAYLLIAVIAVRRRDLWGHAAHMLALYGAFAGVWTALAVVSHLGWLAALRPDVVARLPLYGALGLAMLFVVLSRSFLRLPGPGRRWWLLGAAWAAAVAVLDASVLPLEESFALGGGWRLRRGGVLDLGLIVGWSVFVVSAILLTLTAYRRTQQPLHRNRIKYWVPALGAMVAGDGLLFAGLAAAGKVLHVLGLLPVAYVVLIPRPLDVRQIIRRVLSYTITVLLSVSLYAVSFMVMQAYFFQVAQDYSFLLAGSASALVIVVALNPLLSQVRKRVDRLFTGAGYDPSFTVGEYGMRISNIVELERLAAVALDLINETLGIRGGGLFLVDRKKAADGHEQFELRQVKHKESLQPARGVLSADGPVAQFLRQERLPLTQYDIDLLPAYRTLSAEERAWLHGLNVDVYVPIYAKGKWIGLLAIGSKVSGDRFFEDDLGLLNTLADQTAVALENARLVENLIKLNADLRKAYSALDLANQQLELLDRAKSDFINIASHELRTPLTLVLGYSQILSVDPAIQASAESQHLVGGLHGGAQRMHEIVEAMVDMASIDSRTLQLQRTDVSLHSLIRDICGKFDRPLTERHLTLRVADFSDLPTIEGDPEALGKVFLQLVTNAIKYTPDGGTITLSGDRVSGAHDGHLGDQVEIVVQDTGIGIDPRFKELIFTKFYQTGEVALHSSGKTKFKGGGPGLGLTLARGIVEAHGGKIWAESPGYDETACPGSTFHVVLPLRQQAVSASPPAGLPNGVARR